jgi:hypothetical protein
MEVRHTTEQELWELPNPILVLSNMSPESTFSQMISIEYRSSFITYNGLENEEGFGSRYLRVDNMSDTLDEEFREAWQKLGGDWLAHMWWEVQRRKLMLGKLRKLRDIEIPYPKLKGNIAYSDILRREAIRYIKSQRIQNYKKITEYFTCDKCVEEGKQPGLLEAGYATSKMKIIIQCYHCRKEILATDVVEKGLAT